MYKIVVIDDNLKQTEFEYESAVPAVTNFNKFTDRGDAKYRRVVVFTEPDGRTTGRSFTNP